MKRVIEEFLLDNITTYIKNIETGETELDYIDLDYDVENRILRIKNHIKPYKMVLIRRLIYRYKMPIDNVIVE